MFNDELVPRLTGELPLLNTLELVQVDEDDWELETFKSLTLWISVVKLSIVRCSLKNADLINLITAFQSLEVLRLDHLLCSHNLDMSPTQYLVPWEGEIPSFSLGRLTRLILDVHKVHKFHRSEENSLFEWILNSNIDTLKEMYFGVSIWDAQIRSHFLRNLGPRVRHLEIGFHHLMYGQEEVLGKLIHNVRPPHLSNSPVELCNIFDFSVHTELTSLTLPYPYKPVGLSLLSLVNAPKLEYLGLRLDFWVPALEEEDHLAWDSELASSLATHLCGVRQIRILILKTGDSAHIRKTVLDLFPKARERVQFLVSEYQEGEEWYRSIERPHRHVKDPQNLV